MATPPAAATPLRRIVDEITGRPPELSVEPGGAESHTLRRASVRWVTTDARPLCKRLRCVLARVSMRFDDNNPITLTTAERHLLRNSHQKRGLRRPANARFRDLRAACRGGTQRS